MILLPTFEIRGLDIPSSKNSQVWTGEFLVHSPATQKWKRKTKKQWEELTPKFLEAIEKSGITPIYYIEFQFLRRTKRTFDYNNMSQIIQDSMVKFGWISDDNVRVMKPYFADPILDRVNPGVIIKILKEKPEHYDRTKYT